jgi:uncharacterized protein DUF4389
VFSIAALLFVVAGWFAALVTGRLPQGIHDFLGAWMRYSTWVWAYVFLVTDRFPPFTGRPGAYPLDVEIDPPERQSRWTVGFRLLLAIPALLLESALEGVVHAIAFLGWFVGLALGRMPLGMRNFAVFGLAYRAQSFGYTVLLTGRYPGLDFPKPS